MELKKHCPEKKTCFYTFLFSQLHLLQPWDSLLIRHYFLEFWDLQITAKFLLILANFSQSQDYSLLLGVMNSLFMECTFLYSQSMSWAALADVKFFD